jgi:sodium-dependent phosphate cotransporter
LETTQLADPNKKIRSNLKIFLYIVGALLLFLFSLELTVSSLQYIRPDISQNILIATGNPFVGLFIGLLITAILQSSSTTTSLAVAFVVSGAITLQHAIPLIMGANIGTTVTAMIVSLGFINKRKEFKRATAAASYHVFFNVLTAAILFPLEYNGQFLSRLSEQIAHRLFTPTNGMAAVENTSQGVFDQLTGLLNNLLPSPVIIIILALALLFMSILLFRRLISNLLKAKSPEAFSRFFFTSPWKSFGWGLLTTAAIRSSTITTSIVVPIVAKKIATLRQAAPFIMGANIGTTITVFIAASFHGYTQSAISIAIAHFLFNFIGVALFLPVPILNGIPLRLAEQLGKLTTRFRLAGFIFLLLIFFIIPFSLIYFYQVPA